MRSYYKIFKVAGLSALIGASISIWMFMGDRTFLPVPLGAGIMLAIIQKEDRVYKYLSKLSAGSLVFGFLTALLAQTEMYLISNLVYQSGMPFMALYDPRGYVMFSLVFSFICFLGGLAGVVIKGFYVLSKNKAIS